MLTDAKIRSLKKRRWKRHTDNDGLVHTRTLPYISLVDARAKTTAGSGKTIILALRAAYLHTQNPEWKIAITINTRSLKGQFQTYVNLKVIC